MTVFKVRREYRGQPLVEEEAGADPIALFDRWFTAARDVEPDATAMALATATGDGRPSVRTVLLKGFGVDGFVFYTNYHSRKAREMAANPRVSLLFFWPGHERQVRIEGLAGKVPAAESDAYFVTRPLDSRLSVYASRQSEIIESRPALDARFEAAARRFLDGQVPRPEWWGGYRVSPQEIEFWQGRRGRMHDRLRYTLLASGEWQRERLAP
ncbi:MAG: pyridoxamine 5'-phosphate oxidase [Vicinamibacterales bacterium]